jgi:hypothetical protein
MTHPSSSSRSVAFDHFLHLDSRKYAVRISATEEFLASIGKQRMECMSVPTGSRQREALAVRPPAFCRSRASQLHGTPTETRNQHCRMNSAVQSTTAERATQQQHQQQQQQQKSKYLCRCDAEALCKMPLH